MEYFYLNELSKKEMGPFSLKEIASLLARKKIGKTTPVRVGSNPWSHAGAIPDLMSAAANEKINLKNDKEKAKAQKAAENAAKKKRYKDNAEAIRQKKLRASGNSNKKTNPTGLNVIKWVFRICFVLSLGLTGAMVVMIFAANDSYYLAWVLVGTVLSVTSAFVVGVIQWMINIDSHLRDLKNK